MIKNVHVLFICVVCLLLYNCDNEPYEGEIILPDNACELAMLNVSEALTSFSSASGVNYNMLCQAYKDALQNQIDICGDDGSLQTLIQDLGDCILNTENLCEDAEAATIVAQSAYENATADNFEDVCNNYKDALEYQITVCGDSDFLQDIIVQLDDCRPEFVDLIGVWTLVGWNTDMARDINNDGIVTNNYLEEIDCYTNETIEFNANGTGAFYYRSEAQITYTPNSDGSDEDFFVSCSEINESLNFTWSETINTVEIITENGIALSYLRNGNSLNIGIDDGFVATNTIDGESMIIERVIFVYVKL
ncbi:MAG: hypothetical protein HKN40_07185 [Winogradskyella sp.]|uniref:hypothetical protein n=1 Tax=Winogradskyella sp. TaxID=1883156 RepID=UPI0017AA4DA0|nr:hypothetical protein [Winogradskyella sp.]